MTMPSLNSPDILREEILAAAKRDCERILRVAEETAGSYLARANVEAEKIRSQKLDTARGEAMRRSELILATVRVEIGRMRAERTEFILENIHQMARHRMESRDFNSCEIVTALAAEAIGRMPGTDFILQLSAANHEAFGDQLADNISLRVGRPLELTVMPDSAVADSGVIVQGDNGRQFWDNRLLSRLERLWPELRRQIAVRAGLVETTEGVA